jgi:hypothetical protein
MPEDKPVRVGAKRATAANRGDAYVSGGVGTDQSYVLRRAGPAWEVFYSERGIELYRRAFGRQREAFDYLMQLMR